MMILKTIFPVLSLTFFLQGRGQSNAIFLSEGKIEFEKKVNLYALMGNVDNSWTELQKKSMSQFRTSYFDLEFTPHKTLYKPGKEVTEINSMNIDVGSIADKNIVYNDLDKAQGISQKKVFDELFLVQDSLRRIDWKITDETRTIAGFSCRRANAVILDSIYVVAFYTDEILPSGGPESFTGLPGMILGVALPHQHITWFATVVQGRGDRANEITPPEKGKKVDIAGLKDIIQKSFGKWGDSYIQAALL